MSTENPTEIPYGYCHCGCGKKTNPAPYNRRDRGQAKGQPSRFIRGHSTIPRAAAERFWEKVNKYGPVPWHAPHLGRCWLWTASLNQQGYGQFDWCSAHRWAWRTTNGPVPRGLHLDHLCRVRHCVNPSHLEPVTPVENTRRSSVAKLCVEDVRAIRSSSLSGVELARLYAVAQSTISQARSGVRWRDEPTYRGNPMPDSQLCDAVLSQKYIAGDWRCERKAVAGGFCRQHSKVAAVRVPEAWERFGNRWVTVGEIVTVVASRRAA